MKIGSIYSLPQQSNSKNHYYVVASIKDDDILLFCFSSIKYRDGKQMPFDDACVFDENDNIKDKNEKLLICKKSFILYKMPLELNKNRLKNYEPLGKTDSEILDKIISGVKTTKHIAPYILKQYFI